MAPSSKRDLGEGAFCVRPEPDEADLPSIELDLFIADFIGTAGFSSGWEPYPGTAEAGAEAGAGDEEDDDDGPG